MGKRRVKIIEEMSKDCTGWKIRVNKWETFEISADQEAQGFRGEKVEEISVLLFARVARTQPQPHTHLFNCLINSLRSLTLSPSNAPYFVDWSAKDFDLANYWVIFKVCDTASRIFILLNCQPHHPPFDSPCGGDLCICELPYFVFLARSIYIELYTLYIN